MSSWEPSNQQSPKRLRFNSDDDLALLRQFINENPLEDSEKWGNIQNSVAEITGKLFSIRTLKDHLHLLLEIWLQKDSDSQKKSGIEEIFSERDQLLQEVSDLCKNAEPIGNFKRKRPISKEKQIAELGKKWRDQWSLKLLGNDYIDNNDNQENIEVIVVEKEAPTQNYSDLDDLSNDKVTTPLINSEATSHLKDNELFNENREENKTTPKVSNNSKSYEAKKRILGPVKQRTNKGNLLRKNALEYLQQKEDKDRQIKPRELDLGERKVALEEMGMNLNEKIFELEAAERKEKLNIEKERMRLEMGEREII